MMSPLIRSDLGSTQQKRSTKLEAGCLNHSVCHQPRSTTAIKCRWSSYPVVPNSRILERLYVLDMQGEAIRAIFILNDLKEVFHVYQSSRESSSCILKA